MITYKEFCDKVKDIKFPDEVIRYECTKCGDEHFGHMPSEQAYKLRLKCYRCFPNLPEVKISGFGIQK